MALLGFFHDSSLLIALGISHLMIEEFPSVRERECTRWVEEEEEKSPKNHFAMAVI